MDKYNQGGSYMNDIANAFIYFGSSFDKLPNIIAVEKQRKLDERRQILEERKQEHAETKWAQEEKLKSEAFQFDKLKFNKGFDRVAKIQMDELNKVIDDNNSKNPNNKMKRVTSAKWDDKTFDFIFEYERDSEPVKQITQPINFDLSKPMNLYKYPYEETNNLFKFKVQPHSLFKKFN